MLQTARPHHKDQSLSKTLVRFLPDPVDPFGMGDLGFAQPPRRLDGIELEVADARRPSAASSSCRDAFVAERSFAWTTRNRRPVEDYERCPGTLADLGMVAFVPLMLEQTARAAGGSEPPLTCGAV